MRASTIREIAYIVLLFGNSACSNQQLVAEAWLWDRGAPHFNRTVENEVHSFWRVVPGKVDEAVEAIGRGSFVTISPEDAARFLATRGCPDFCV